MRDFNSIAAFLLNKMYLCETRPVEIFNIHPLVLCSISRVTKIRRVFEGLTRGNLTTKTTDFASNPSAENRSTSRNIDFPHEGRERHIRHEPTASV